jgi:prepilin-type N-terminal cleavage/methylation domain-containing protein
MQPKNNRQPERERAFTLIELLVVIAIVGILAGLAVVSMSGATEAARIAKGLNLSGSTQHFLAADPIGIWNFDSQDGSDSSGKGVNGTVYNGTYSTSTPYGNGVANRYSLNFNGSNTWVDTNFASTSQGVWTMEAWVYDKKTSGWRVIVQVNADNDDGLYIYPANGLGFYPCGSVGSVPPNKWVHVAAVYNNGFTYYIDGNKVGTGGVCADAADWEFLRIGALSAGDGERFSGMIDDVRIYSQPMRTSQIVKDYLAGLDRLLADDQITEQDYQQRLADLDSTYAANE